MRISEWSSDVCSSDLTRPNGGGERQKGGIHGQNDQRRSCLENERSAFRSLSGGKQRPDRHQIRPRIGAIASRDDPRRNRETRRSEEHTSELQSLMRISYAVFCLKKKKPYKPHNNLTQTIHVKHHDTHTASTNTNHN